MGSPTVTLRLTADNGQLIGTLRASKAALAELGGNADKSARDLGQYGSAAERITRQNLGMSQSLNSAARLFRGLIGAAVIREAVQAADAYANIDAQLKLFTQTEERHRAALSQTYAIAQRTYSGLESTATLYGRLQKAVDELGGSQQTALRTTELINKSFQISGTGAASAEAAIIQLTQGLSAGALRGEELNSVFEQAPRLVDALSAATGKNRGELRAMAEQGQLTADVIIDALESQGEVIDREFNQLPVTAERAWTQLKNAATVAIGEINQSTGATGLLADAIQNMAVLVERLPVGVQLWSEAFDEAERSAGGLGDFMGAFADRAMELFARIRDEILILPQSLKTAVSIIIGEADKLRLRLGFLFTGLIGSSDVAWAGIKTGFLTLVERVKLAGVELVQSLLSRFSQLRQGAAEMAEAAGFDQIAEKLKAPMAATDALGAVAEASKQRIADLANEYQRTAEVADDALAQANRDLQAGIATADESIAASLADREAALSRVKAVKTLVEASDELVGGTRKVAAATEEEIKAHERAQEALEKLAEVRARNADQTRLLVAEMAGPLAAAQEQHRQDQEKLTEEYLKGERTLADYARAQQALERQYDKTTTAIKAQRSPTEQLLDNLREEAQTIGLTADEMYMYNVRKAAQAALLEQGIDLSSAQAQAYIAEAEALGRTNAAQSKAADTARQAADDYQRLWLNAAEQVGDALTTALVDGFDKGADALKDMAKNLVRDLISFFIRQKIVIPLQQQMMGQSGADGQGGGFNLGNLRAPTTAGRVMGFAAGAYGVYDAYHNGPGGLQGGLQGAASGAMAGAQIAGVPGAVVGAIIGGLAGLLGGSKKPDVRIGGMNANVRKPENVFQTELGTVQIGTRATDQTPIREAVQNFDANIASIVRSFTNGDAQLQAVQQAVAQWSVDLKGSAATAENILGSRFKAVLSAFSTDVQAYVNQATKLEDQVARLGEAAFIDAAARSGELFDNFSDLARVLGDNRLNGESIEQTYNRVLVSTQLLDAALANTGTSLDLTREQVIQFATDITTAAGGLDRAAQLWSDYFGTFYSEQERAALSLTQSQSNASTQFSDIGLNAGDYTGEGGTAAFRALFEQALPTLSAEAVVQWLEAASALGQLNELQAQYNATLGETAETNTDAAERAARLTDLMAGIGEQSAQTADALATLGMSELQQQLRAVAQATAAAIAQATALGATEEQLAQIRQLGADQAALATAQAQSQLTDLLAGLRFDNALAGMTEVEQQTARVTAQFEAALTQAVALGASEEQLAEIRGLEQAALDNVQNSARAVTVSVNVASEAMNYFADAMQGVRNEFKPEAIRQWINELAGFTPEEVAKSMSLADVREAVAKKYADEAGELWKQITRVQDERANTPWFNQRQRNYLERQLIDLHYTLKKVTDGVGDSLQYVNDIFAQRLDDLLGGLRKEFNAADPIAEVNQRFDDLIQQATDYGATQTQIAEIESYRAKALLEATQKQSEADDAKFEKEMDWVRRLAGLRDSLLLDKQLTTLTPAEQLAEAKSQYQAAFAAAQVGDEAARGNFENIARTYAERLRDFYGSADAYTQGFSDILADIQSLIDGSPATAAQQTVTSWLPSIAAGEPNASQATVTTVTPTVSAINTLNTTTETGMREMVTQLRDISRKVTLLEAAQKDTTAETKRGNDQLLKRTN